MGERNTLVILFAIFVSLGGFIFGYGMDLGRRAFSSSTFD